MWVTTCYFRRLFLAKRAVFLKIINNSQTFKVIRIVRVEIIKYYFNFDGERA